MDTVIFFSLTSLIRRKIMNKLNPIFILTSLLLSFLSNTALARSEAPAIPIHSEVVDSHEIAQSLSLIGKLQSKQYVDISAEVTAKVTRIAVTPNQTVEKDQLLVELDDGSADALLAEAEAYLLDQERVLKDYKRLIKKQAITQTELDAQAATVTIGKARLLAAQVFVNNHRIVAPFAGTIGLIDFSLGKNVSIGETLLTLDNLSQMTLDLPIPERYLSQVEIGMEVSAVSRAWEGETFIGKVESIDSRVNADSLNLRVRIIFENPELKLKPGMMMSARLVFKPVDEPIISVQSIEYSGTKRFVYVVGDDNTVERREVILGARIEDKALIESGVEVGERLVVQGLVNMRDGIKIKDLSVFKEKGEGKQEAKKDKK